MKGIEMKLTKTQQEAVANLFLLGESLRKIAKNYGVNYHQIRKACLQVLGKEHYEMVSAKHAKLSSDGLKLRGEKHTKKIEARNKEILAEYESGVSVVEIAAKYGLSYRQIYKIVKRMKNARQDANGCQKNKPKTQRYKKCSFTHHCLDNRFMEIAQMVARKTTVAELCAKFNVSRRIVRDWLKMNLSEAALKNVGK